MSRKRDSWKNNERHYCAICNSWMGSDRQSILLHENGRKHKEKVQEMMDEKRREKTSQDAQEKALQASLQSMEAAAQASVAGDLSYFAGTMPQAIPVQSMQQTYQPVVSHRAPPPPPPPPRAPPRAPPQNSSNKQEKKEWESRKRQRQEERKPKIKQENSDDAAADQEQQHAHSRRFHRKVAPDEGHYTLPDDNVDSKQESTYLEGRIFGGMLEIDMPVQLWRGSVHATSAEQRLPASAGLWTSGLVVKRSLKNDTVDVAYLASPDATEETIEQGVSLHRIRMVLGGDPDLLPDTLTEARLLAGLDDEEEEVTPAAAEAKVDEATGLTSWTTVRIKRTTVRKELQEERARLREKRREAAAEAARQTKLAEARRMEEAAVANAEDSALGAFDIWNRGSKEGYKGVNIHDGEQQQQGSVHDVMGKKLSEGKPVGFQKKSSAFKAKKKKQNRRRTSADDD